VCRGAFSLSFGTWLFRPDSFGPDFLFRGGLLTRVLRPCAADSGGIGIRVRLPRRARRGGSRRTRRPERQFGWVTVVLQAGRCRGRRHGTGVHGPDLSRGAPWAGLASDLARSTAGRVMASVWSAARGAGWPALLNGVIRAWAGRPGLNARAA
jgi:hypothetical protein